MQSSGYLLYTRIWSAGLLVQMILQISCGWTKSVSHQRKSQKNILALGDSKLDVTQIAPCDSKARVHLLKYYHGDIPGCTLYLSAQ